MTITYQLRQRIRQQANDRCGYCQSLQKYSYVPFEIEHILPTAVGGTDDEINLWLSCRVCNAFKGVRTTGIDPEIGLVVPLFNPRRQVWDEEFRWSDDDTVIIGLTPIGRATVAVLRLNRPQAVETRRLWVSVGWHPPSKEG